jgi:hypothetical protein
MSPDGSRTILVHLNVKVPPEDQREPDEISEAIMAAFVVGSDDDSVRELVIVNALTEEL